MGHQHACLGRLRRTQGQDKDRTAELAQVLRIEGAAVAKTDAGGKSHGRCVCVYSTYTLFSLLMLMLMLILILILNTDTDSDSDVILILILILTWAGLGWAGRLGAIRCRRHRGRISFGVAPAGLKWVPILFLALLGVLGVSR